MNLYTGKWECLEEDGFILSENKAFSLLIPLNTSQFFQGQWPHSHLLPHYPHHHPPHHPHHHHPPHHLPHLQWGWMKKDVPD